MTPIQCITRAAIAACLTAHAPAAEYAFGPIHGRPGEKVRMVSHLENTEGTYQYNNDPQLHPGTSSATRDSDLTWTFLDVDAEGTKRGMLRVSNLTTSTTTQSDGKKNKVDSPSPLVGQLIEMSKPAKGEWKFDLDGSVPYFRVEAEMESFSVYLKRKWYPESKVKLGDSWEFEPVWLKSMISKDLKKAKIFGTMRLQQVRHAERGQTALIDVTIRSSGGDFQPDGLETGVSLTLDGKLIVNLDTMLEESLELKGTLTTKVSSATESTTTKLPISFKVTKTFVR